MSLTWRSKIRSWITLIAILFIGGVPSGLVFIDRWLSFRNLHTPLDTLWCRVVFLCKTGLPGYFATAILYIILLVILLVLVGRVKNDSAPGSSRSLFKDTTALRSRREMAEIPVSKRQLLISHLALGGAIYLATGCFIYSVAVQQIFSLGFLIAFGLYLASWLIRDFQARPAVEFIQQNWRGLLAMGFVNLSLILLLKANETQDRAIWLLLAASAIGLLLLWPRLRDLPAPAFWLVNIAMVLFTYGVSNWAYSIVGDEYDFFHTAAQVVENMPAAEILANFFDGTWVYGQHPFFSTWIQSLSMRFLGVDSFGWRFSSIYLSAFSVGLFYLFFKNFLRRRVALLAALFLAFSAYLMAFSKIGYNNLQSLFMMSVVLNCSAWAISSRRLIAYVLTGLSLGVCFYVYPASLYVVPLPVLLLCLYDPPLNRQAIRRWVWLFISLVVMLLPLFMQVDYWLSKELGWFSNNASLTFANGSMLQHLFTNFLLAFVSPLYIVEESHFVVVGYMDFMSAMMLWIGLGVVIKWVRRDRFLVFILLCYLFLLFFVGATHDRNFPPATRMFLLLPWFCLLAAIGLEWLVGQIRSSGLISERRSLLLLFLVVCVILCLNLVQANPLSWKRSSPRQGLETMFLRMIQSTKNFEPQVIQPRTFMFITDTHWGIDGLFLMAKVYDFPAWRVRLERMVIDGPALPQASTEKIADRYTLVIFQVSLDPDWRAAVEEELVSLGKKTCPIREYINKDARFMLWYTPGLEAFCISGQ
jgi:hypothetical protein